MNSNIPTILTVFGATGSLMKKKIVPTLFHLFKKGKLPDKFKIIGFSRRSLSISEFRSNVREVLLKHSEENSEPKPKEKDILTFLSLFDYKSGFFEEINNYKELEKILMEVDKDWGVCSSKLFYIATRSSYYKTICENLSKSKLTEKCNDKDGWTRILLEKPIGEDLNSAERLENIFSKLFKEEQVYRVDHYLQKEMLQNILSFRFSNNLFESNWDNKKIEKIKIKLLERGGVENRGSFYDSTGALRDVGQNHLLEILALLTMDQPESFESEEIHSKRSEILGYLKKLDEEEVKNNTIRAQYEGYNNISEVKSDSQTETYFRIKASLDSSRWKGVPIILESGKGFNENLKEIVIKFRHTAPCLCPGNNGKHLHNKLIIQLEPEKKIDIKFWSKKSGFKNDIEERVLNFMYLGKGSKVKYVEEYEKVILDAIIGKRTFFASSREVLSSWRFVDPILNAWNENLVPLRKYEVGSDSVLENKFSGEVVIEKKEIGIMGLGKMGGNISRNLIHHNWNVYGYNRSPERVKELIKYGLNDVYSVEDLIKKLSSPRIIWVMVPAGDAVEEVLFDKKSGLYNLLKKGDIIIDGGNSFYKDSIERHQRFLEKGIHYLDIGVSGGPEGALKGTSLMIGGGKEVYEYLIELFEDLSTPNGYNYIGSSGAGHFVKMIHNGIEYGMMQSIAEGFNILKKSDYNLDLKDISEIYNNGSVIESKLIGWLNKSFILHGIDLEGVSGKVNHTGEAEWTVQTAKEMKLDAKIIEESLNFRKNSRETDYVGKILSALREQFGGHSSKS